MLTNKIIIELDLPNPKPEERQEAEEVLTQQVQRHINFLKAVLGDYKKEFEISVPSLAIRLPSNLKKEQEDSPAKIFAKTLVEHHMKRVPTAHRGRQHTAVKTMYEAGYTNAEELLRLYDKRVESWEGTSWFTIWYDIKKGLKPEPDAPEDMTFKRDELDAKKVDDLKNRLSQYSNESD